MKKLFVSLFTVILTGGIFLSPAGFMSQAADTVPAIGSERTFQAANKLPVTVKVIGPVQAQADLQIICLFKHKPDGDTYLEALDDLDQKLGGAIRSLRNRGEFAGDALETVLITPPKDSIPAKKLLIIGLGEESALNIDTMRRIGTVALRSAKNLNAVNVAYAPTIRDQGNSSIPTGEVAAAVMNGVISGYDTEKRLEKEGLTDSYTIGKWIFEAGPKFYNEVASALDQTVKKANAEISTHPYRPYMTGSSK